MGDSCGSTAVAGSAACFVEMLSDYHTNTSFLSHILLIVFDCLAVIIIIIIIIRFSSLDFVSLSPARTSQQEANAVALMQRHIRGALTRRAIKKQTTAAPYHCINQ